MELTEEQNAALMASAPSLLKENQELKEQIATANNLITHKATIAVDQFNKINELKSINEELIKALEHARTYMREFGCTDEHVFLKIDNALNNAK
jgi:GTP1/Obg family GTP-binding protein